eukprot:554682-Pleurochrysis_carterae.AAC.1
MWAQQWRYVCSALERRYRVLRADTDVYFAEDPYPILNGPLLRPYAMVVQQAVDNGRIQRSYIPIPHAHLQPDPRLQPDPHPNPGVDPKPDLSPTPDLFKHATPKLEPFRSHASKQELSRARARLFAHK